MATDEEGANLAKSTKALCEIAAERRRQILDEGWDAAHDDAHHDDELIAAAVTYAMTAVRKPGRVVEAPEFWPWDEKWFKPKDRRRDLVRAAALIVAELERMDRNV